MFYLAKIALFLLEFLLGVDNRVKHQTQQQVVLSSTAQSLIKRERGWQKI